MDSEMGTELIYALKEISYELKTTNKRLSEIEETLDKIYSGLP